VAQSIGLFSKLQRNRENRVNRLKTNEYLTVKFNQSILIGRKSVVSFISVAYLVHNKKVNVHIIDSNKESDEEMSNTPPDIAVDNRNNCPVTINYVKK
jgi:hypothetical protein